MNAMKNYVIALVLCALVMAGSAYTQTKDSRNLDIEILENVLSKMMQHNISDISWNSEATGFYLPDFGYLFKTSANRMLFRTAPAFVEVKRNRFDRMHRELKKNRKDLDSLKVTLESMKNDIYIDEKTDSLYTVIVDDMKKKITEFMLRYASTLTPAFSDEKIVILVDLDNFTLGAKEHPSLHAWARVSDLAKNRGGKSGGSVISFSSNGGETGDVKNQISIFQSILNRMVSQPSRRASATYYQGVGAICFLNVPSALVSKSYKKALSLIYRDKKSDDEDVYIPMTIESNDKKESEEESEEKRLETYKQKVIDAIVKYGHTIDLKDNEHLIILLNTDNTFNFMHENSNDSFIIRVSAKDISAFSSGALTKKQFRNTIKVTAQ